MTAGSKLAGALKSITTNQAEAKNIATIAEKASAFFEYFEECIMKIKVTRNIGNKIAVVIFESAMAARHNIARARTAKDFFSESLASR